MKSLAERAAWRGGDRPDGERGCRAGRAVARRRHRRPDARARLRRRGDHHDARAARRAVRARPEALRGRRDLGHRQLERTQGRHLRPAARVPADLGGALRRHAQHRRAAVRRALHQDDARPQERHRRVRRLHGRRLLVRRHRARGLRLPDRRLHGVARVPAVDLRFHAAGAGRRCITGATRPMACSTTPTARCCTTAATR